MPTLMQAPRDVVAALQKKLDDAECGVQYDLRLESLSAEHKRQIKVAKDKEGRSEGSIRVSGPVTKFADQGDLSKDGFLRRPEAVAKAILAMITSRGDDEEEGGEGEGEGGAGAGQGGGAQQHYSYYYTSAPVGGYFAGGAPGGVASHSYCTASEMAASYDGPSTSAAAGTGAPAVASAPPGVGGLQRQGSYVVVQPMPQQAAVVQQHDPQDCQQQQRHPAATQQHMVSAFAAAAAAASAPPAAMAPPTAAPPPHDAAATPLPRTGHGGAGWTASASVAGTSDCGGPAGYNNAVGERGDDDDGLLTPLLADTPFAGALTPGGMMEPRALEWGTWGDSGEVAGADANAEGGTGGGGCLLTQQPGVVLPGAPTAAAAAAAGLAHGALHAPGMQQRPQQHPADSPDSYPDVAAVHRGYHPDAAAVHRAHPAEVAPSWHKGYPDVSLAHLGKGFVTSAGYVIHPSGVAATQPAQHGVLSPAPSCIDEYAHLSDEQLEELAWETAGRLDAMHAALYMRDTRRRETAGGGPQGGGRGALGGVGHGAGGPPAGPPPFAKRARVVA